MTDDVGTQYRAWVRDNSDKDAIYLTKEEGSHLSPGVSVDGLKYIEGVFIYWVNTPEESSLHPYRTQPDNPWNRQEGGDHYTRMAIQPSEYIVRNGLDWFAGNVIKYVSRYRAKGNPLRDLKKARHYIDLAIAEVEREQGNA